jgi:amino acid transporter
MSDYGVEVLTTLLLFICINLISMAIVTLRRNEKKRGDQIWRILGCCVIVYFGQLFENHKRIPNLGLSQQKLRMDLAMYILAIFFTTSFGQVTLKTPLYFCAVRQEG